MDVWQTVLLHLLRKLQYISYEEGLMVIYALALSAFLHNTKLEFS